MDPSKKTEHSSLHYVVTVAVTIVGLLGSALNLFGIANIELLLQNYFLAPGLVYTTDQAHEYFSCQFPLQSGKLRLHPQLEITYNGSVIKILHLKNFYPDNVSHYQEDLPGFSVPLGDWNEAEYVAGCIKDELISLLGDESFREKISIKQVILLQLTYQNKKKTGSDTAYYYVEDRQSHQIKEKNMQKRIVETDIVLEHAADSISEIVQDCLHVIRTNSN